MKNSEMILSSRNIEIVSRNIIFYCNSEMILIHIYKYIYIYTYMNIYTHLRIELTYQYRHRKSD